MTKFKRRFSSHRPNPDIKGFCACGSDMYTCQLCNEQFCANETPPKWDTKLTGNPVAGNMCQNCYTKAKTAAPKPKNAASDTMKKSSPRKFYLSTKLFNAKWTLWKVKAAGEQHWVADAENVMRETRENTKLIFHWATKYETGLERVSGVLAQINTVVDGAEVIEKWFLTFDCIKNMTPEIIQKNISFIAYLKSCKLCDVLDEEIKERKEGSTYGNPYWRNRFNRNR